MKEFVLKNTDFIPLCDLLKVTGLSGTGGQAKIVIAEGLVQVDGVVELRKRCKIRENQVVMYDNHLIKVVQQASE